MNVSLRYSKLNRFSFNLYVELFSAILYRCKKFPRHTWMAGPKAQWQTFLHNSGTTGVVFATDQLMTMHCNMRLHSITFTLKNVTIILCWKIAIKLIQGEFKYEWCVSSFLLLSVLVFPLFCIPPPFVSWFQRWPAENQCKECITEAKKLCSSSPHPAPTSISLPSEHSMTLIYKGCFLFYTGALFFWVWINIAS